MNPDRSQLELSDLIQIVVSWPLNAQGLRDAYLETCASSVLYDYADFITLHSELFSTPICDGLVKKLLVWAPKYD